MQLVRWFKLSKLTSSILSHLKPLHSEYTSISEEIIKISTEPQKVNLMKELQKKQLNLEAYAEMTKLLDQTIKSLDDLEVLRNEKEMAEVVEEEMKEKELELESLEEEALDMILEKDIDDESNVIIEIKPGVGGSESSLFSEDLLNMYIGFSASMDWRHTILQLSADTQINKGVKEAVVKFEGTGVYSMMKFESGVHKVIRVPETEKAGRLHSSTACVIVLPDRPPVNVM